MPLDLATALNHSCWCFAHWCWSLSSLSCLCVVPICPSPTRGRQHPWQIAVSMSHGLLIPTTISLEHIPAFCMMLWFLHKFFSCLVTGPVLITPCDITYPVLPAAWGSPKCSVGILLPPLPLWLAFLQFSSFFCPGCYSFPLLAKSLGVFQNMGSSLLCSWCSLHVHLDMPITGIRVIWS